MDLIIVIVNYNTKNHLRRCLESITSKRWENDCHIVVVDNNSTDDSYEFIYKDFPKVDFLKNTKNLGFSKGSNIGIKSGKAGYYLLLNSDTKLNEGFIDNLLKIAKQNNWGICTGKILNSDGSLQPNAGYLPTAVSLFLWLSGIDDFFSLFGVGLPSFHIRDANFFSGDKDVGWVSGAAMLIKKKVFEQIGYFDEEIFMYGEDVDFCLRAKKAGFKIGWTDKTTLFHIGGASSADPKFNQWAGEFKGILYLVNKHYGLFFAFCLKFLLYLFITIRIIAFFLIGRFNISKTYGKIISGI